MWRWMDIVKSSDLGVKKGEQAIKEIIAIRREG
jgi:hypothetical protein